MGSDIDDPSLVEYHDPVSVPDRRKAVCNNNGSPCLHERLKCLLDKHFRHRIERRCSLIENKDRRVLQDRREQWLSAAFVPRTAEPTFAYEGAISVCQLVDETICIRQACCMGDLFFRCARPAKGDILPDRVIEKNNVLAHNADQFAEGWISISFRSTLSSHIVPPVGPVESRDQVHKRRLADAASADNGHYLSRSDRKVHAPDHGMRTPRVGEHDVFKPQAVPEPIELIVPFSSCCVSKERIDSLDRRRVSCRVV